ncbi:glycosyl hydrolase family 18 protein [Burkholderia ubonensis]|uniref:glycosyl hydrolase family 18 protein n=1 Tax=Burkholderia ubonensis TaxID=101571 RepID=UPI0007589959|nr:glycosyl hydrolase family 18 protein [Burkholderia ubonensis]KVK98994.1 chitinase [Burkholderia ubonensis]KVN74694.1 chitinase [Burkholderia ubonensis]KVO39562.1 chitinase [Burkholderia ubonensis]KVQ54190.1 chitinase [Burkholderia ubonensis]KWD49528.1 chitinase [Burkholderia ubonensis]
MSKFNHQQVARRVKKAGRTAIAGALALAFASSAFAAPGTPSLKGWEINGWGKSYGFVQIDTTKAGAEPYKDLVKLNPHPEVPLPFVINNGDAAVKAVALIDGKVDPASEVKFGEGGTKDGKVVAHPTKAGVLKFQVRAFAADGSYTDSAPIDVTVFDTVPELAQDLPNHVSPNVKPFVNKDGSVVGTYFATWSIYGRKFDMSQVPVENLTHILYGFVPICGGDGINDSLKEQGDPFQALQKSCQGLPNYSVAIHDGWGEIGTNLPGADKGPLKGVLGQMMAAKKRNPNLKILPSIGGWTLSDPFFQLDNEANRKVFIGSVEQFLRTWKFFDGVDIDWEFPGGGGANPKLGKPTDGQTYVTLMKELRGMLDKLGNEYGKHYELTSAIGAGKDKIDRINYKDATKYMDYIFDMTYDYYGGWDMNTLGHQTALHAPKWRPNQSYTSANSMQALIDQGVDPKKLVMGVAAYGRGWTGVHGLTDQDNPFTGKATGPHAGQWEKGILDYKKIAAEFAGKDGKGANGYEYHYDATAEAPYLWNPKTGDLITYDDARSTIAKGQYVQQHKLGGVFSWEIDADNGDILNAMHEGLGHASGSGSANQPPIANAGADLAVQGPKTVTLDGTGSRDPEGEPLAYRWEQTGGASLLLEDSDKANARVTVPEVHAATEYRFRLTVTDPHGLSKSASVTVTAKPADVKPSPDPKPDPKPDPTPMPVPDPTPAPDPQPTPTPVNHAPVANIAGPDRVMTGVPGKFDASGSTDADGDKLTFVWNAPSELQPTPSGDKLLFVAPHVEHDTPYTVRVKVSDGKETSEASYVVTVTPKSRPDGGDKGDQGGDGDKGESHPQYQQGTAYKAGDVVSNGGKLYECKPWPYSGWCGQAPAAYEPGKGWAWNDAWTEK